MCAQLLSHVQVFATPKAATCQALLSMGLKSGLPFPPPGDLPNPGTEAGSPALQADSLLFEPPGKPLEIVLKMQYPTIAGIIFYIIFHLFFSNTSASIL